MNLVGKWSLLLVSTMCLLVATKAAGQTKQSEPPSPETPLAAPAPEAVAKLLQAVDQQSGLDEKAKKKLRGLYKDALAKLNEAAASKAEAKRFARDIANADEDEKKMRVEYAALLRGPDRTVSDAGTVKQAQVELNKASERLKQLQSAFESERQELSRRDKRVKAIAKELKSAQEKLADVETQLQEAKKLKGPAGLAQQTLYAAWKVALQENCARLEKERDAYAFTVAHLPIRRNLAAQRVFYAARETRLWRDILAKRRERELVARIDEAKSLLRNAPEPLKLLAENTLDHARQAKTIRKQLDEASHRLDEVKKVVDNIGERRRRTEQMIAALGLTNVVGKILIADRATLPSARAYLRSSSARQAALQKLRFDLFELEEKRANIDDVKKSALTEVDAEQAEPYFKMNQEFLDGLITDSTSCLYELVELDATERKLVEEVRALALYIDKHVLWIASAPPLGRKSDAKNSMVALRWLLEPRQWAGLGQSLRDDMLQNWLFYATVLLTFSVVLILSRRMRTKLLIIGERVEKSGFNRFWPTMEALILTLLVAVIFPIPMWLLGWRLSLAQDDTTLTRALGGALMLSGRVFLLLMLIRHVCRAKGLAGAHFGWTDTDLGKLRRYVRLLALVIVPLSFVAGLMQSQPELGYRNSLGRVCFVLAHLILAIFAHRMLRPKSGLLYHLSVARSAKWVTKFRYVWYLAGVGAPLALAILAVIGYYYTAWQLMLRLEATVWLLFGLLLGSSILLRWLRLAKRWVALYQLRRRNKEEKTQTEVAANENEAAPPQSAAPQLDLARVNVQMRRLLLSVFAVIGLIGLWFIWIDVFPALTFLDQVPLWSKTVTATTQSGTAQTTIERIEPVTLFDLLVALLIIAFAFVIVRNLAGLFQLLMLEHLPLDASLRFTIMTITRYILVLVVILIVSDLIGLSWSSVQWLVAALMIGLGFGLQEIFANFVSGIILLIERPIRVGDLVTVGKTSGTVSKIQMRATTIRDWNKRELVVPNKQLVTGELVNWSLTDSTYRVDLNFGIAYGSDTESAREILLQIAKDHTDILDKPTPKAIFKKFGDSALEFEFRICIPHMDYWPRIVTEVNQAIDRRFREAGIVIAFPQRDIHIRTVADGETGEEGVLRRLQEPTRQAGGN